MFKNEFCKKVTNAHIRCGVAFMTLMIHCVCILKFDKRTTDGFVQSLTTEGTNASGPVYSLQYIAKNENNSHW